MRKPIIVYEDSCILVIDKPSGMPTIPSRLHQGDTLSDFVKEYLEGNAGENEFIFRCINRLDKDTSGLTLIAKDKKTAADLYEQMKKNNIHREYEALVEGKVEGSGTIDLPIARESDNPHNIRRTISKDGENAITHYEVICQTADPNDGRRISKVHFKLETGRTHQIRVHMAYTGHAIVGDRLYNNLHDRNERMELYAVRLAFNHPVTNKKIFFETEGPRP